MANVFPGAIYRPIPGTESRPYRSKGRAVIFHVAVSEGASLYNVFTATGNDSHLYVRRDGSLEQYVDMDRVSYASMAANSSTISVETQGGVTNPDGEPWTPQQVSTLASIARWAHNTEGVPLTVMPNSLAGSKGIGWHRLGIDPWRVAGGEVWSSSRGKLCPGAAKIAQVPQIIALAQGAQEDDMTPDESLALMQIRDYLGANGGLNSKTPDTVGFKVTDLHTALPKLLAGAPPVVDAQALAAALVADTAAVATLADALAAAIAKRLGNG